MVSFTILSALIAIAIAAPVAEPQLQQVTSLIGGLGGAAGGAGGAAGLSQITGLIGGAGGAGAKGAGGALNQVTSNLPVDIGVATNPIGALGVQGNGSPGSSSTAPKPANDNFSNAKKP